MAQRSPKRLQNLTQRDPKFVFLHYDYFFQSSGDMMLNSGMPMNRMQQQQQPPGMNCPPGSTNGQGLMTNGSDLQQQQQMSMNPQSFASNQYHQVRRHRLLLIRSQL